MLDITGGRLQSRAWSTGESVDAVVRVPASTLFLALYARIGTLERP